MTTLRVELFRRLLYRRIQTTQFQHTSDFKSPVNIKHIFVPPLISRFCLTRVIMGSIRFLQTKRAIVQLKLRVLWPLAKWHLSH